jgi:putative two-component system response regulator
MIRILVVGSSPDLADLVEQAALAADVGPFKIDSSEVAPADEGTLLACDALVVEHAAPATDAVDETRRCRDFTHGGVPIVVVARSDSDGFKRAVLEAGAADVLVRPFTNIEFERRVGGVLRQRACKRALEEKERWIEAQVAKVRRELEARQEEIILRLCRAGGYRDHETGEHIIRMARYCQLIAEELGFPAETCRFIYSAAQMHDIGKIGIPDDVLGKPSALSPDEFELIRAHPVIGARILRSIPFLALHLPIVELHHERPDGRGYPHGLVGEAIPLAARIVHVADAYDAMTSARAYRPARSSHEAIAELHRQSGVDFDTAAVRALVTALPKFSADLARLDPMAFQFATFNPTPPRTTRVAGAPDRSRTS